MKSSAKSFLKVTEAGRSIERRQTIDYAIERF
jgi:hypothetical protein